MSDLVSNDVITFLNVLFDPEDYLTIRPIETWEENEKKIERLVGSDVHLPRRGVDIR